MARATRAVVQNERLSDQVYGLLRDDLLSGQFAPGERLVELELAERYKVSRTPVREALVQLSRDGLLVGNERGYITPVYTRADIMHRLEIKRLLEPRLAEHAAAEAGAQQLKALRRIVERERSAHAANKLKAFLAASQDFRREYRQLCKNTLLVRCTALVDDQFESARARIHAVGANREKTIEYNGKLLAALEARSPKAAAAVTIEMLDFIETYYKEHPTSDFS